MFLLSSCYNCKNHHKVATPLSVRFELLKQSWLELGFGHRRQHQRGYRHRAGRNSPGQCCRLLANRLPITHPHGRAVTPSRLNTPWLNVPVTGSPVLTW
jgi:hypothetical protein